MPTYEYRCTNGHDFEDFVLKISAAKMELPCPTCGARGDRRMSAGGGLLFKGSGFYITDYGKDGKKSSAVPAKTDSAKGESAKGDNSNAKGSTSEGARNEGSKGESSKGESAKGEGSQGGSAKREGATGDNAKSAAPKAEGQKSDAKPSGSAAPPPSKGTE